MMTQFGVQFQPTSEWRISKRIFREMKIPERLIRPFEGDLLMVGAYNSTAVDAVYTNSLFEITHVKRDSPNWALGRYFMFSLTCQLYVISNEKFDTLNTHIDRINTQSSNEEDLKFGINEALENKKVDIVDFDEINPFGSL